MFWLKLAQLIINRRVPMLLLVLLSTGFMAYQASQIKLGYELAKILPQSDENFKLYEDFKARYGEDGNVIAIGIETQKMYDLQTFDNWYDLNQHIKAIEGIKNVVSNANLVEIIRNDSLKRFDFKPLVSQKPKKQSEVDSVRAKIDRTPFYKGLIMSQSGGAHLMLITLDQSKLNSKNRITICEEIKAEALAFGKTNDVHVHLSGMPYIRTEFMGLVKSEMTLFSVLAFAVTALILLLFFRSGVVMFVSMFVVALGVLWSMGWIVLFGFKISLLTGLIPSLIVVIGVPNSVFIINKYHEEYARHGNKMKALTTATEKIGETTFWANITTSIGFGVFYLTGSPLLLEFGLVAALSVMATYAVSLVMIPVLFSFLPPPKKRHVARLENKTITAFLRWVNGIVQTRRSLIYSVVAVLTALGIWGITKITAIGYIVDDLPADSAIYTDLKFVERNFNGILPFEVAIDARRPGRALQPQTLTKIKLMQKEFAKYSEFAKPVSLVEAIKVVYQAYRGGDPKYFVLPPVSELNKLTQYINTVDGKENAIKGFLDSTRQHTRVSFQIADVGTRRITELYDILQPKIDTIFNFDRETGQMLPAADRYDARITGNSVVFTKGNTYLQKNLVESTLLAILLISILMVILFGDWRMILIAIVPSLVPLLITAGIMGLAGIHLKPSTTLIFSIAFGLSSDGTIYFLTKYKDESRNAKRSVQDAVTQTILLTGISMFYTAIILFSGFAIYAASTFQGTVALGILVSITLLMGMASNLILLPAFLLTLNKRMAPK